MLTEKEFTDEEKDLAFFQNHALALNEYGDMEVEAVTIELFVEVLHRAIRVTQSGNDKIRYLEDELEEQESLVNTLLDEIERLSE